MPYDSNGNFVINRNRAVTGQTVQAAQVNTPFDDVQSGLSQVLLRSGVAPMTGALNMNGFKVNGVPDATNPTDLVTLSQVQSLLSDPWAIKVVGEHIALDTAIVGVSPPPKDRAYRYVILSAGESSAGGYNEGILTGETVTGTAPNIVATAVISLAGSPINGKTIRLINTTREFHRPGNPGVSEAGKIQSHTHGTSQQPHSHLMNAVVGSGGVGAAIGQAAPSSNEIPTARVVSQLATVDISVLSTGSDETAPRSYGINYYMRIL